MKRVVIFGIVICLIFIYVGLVLGDTAQITLTDENKGIEVDNVATLTGLYEQANWHFQYDTTTLNAMCFYANYSNNPIVQNKKMISGTYISGADSKGLSAPFDECVLIWSNGWTKKCAQGGNVIRYPSNILCNVEFTEHSRCANVFVSDTFSTNPSLNNNWTMYRSGSGASTSNTAVWESSQFTLTKNAEQVEGGLDFNGQLTNDTWTIEFDLKMTEQKDCADGIYLYFDKYNSANVKTGNFGVEYDNFQNPSSDVLYGTTSPPHDGCNGNGNQQGKGGAIAVIEGNRDTADYKHFNFSNEEIACEDFSGSFKSTKIVFYRGKISVSLNGVPSVSYNIGNSFSYLKLRLLGDTGADYSLQQIDNLKINTSLCSPLTCSDYIGRCGSGLSDGFGGTLDCSNNCASGQTCNATSGYCYVPPVLGNSCINTNQTIMKLYEGYNSHGALWNESSTTYSLCFNEVFGYYYNQNAHLCNQENTPVLYLSSINNAHASLSSNSVYNIPICFGNLNCRNILSSSCNSDENLTLRLSNETNAHISNASDSNYPVKICCKNSPIAVSGNAVWQNMRTENILDAQKNDTVKLVLNRSDVFNKNISYEIYKKDGNSFLFVFKWDKLVGQFSSIGFATWKANETGEFYFNATVEEFADVYSSQMLTVGEVGNTLPSITIIKPIENSTFIINSNTNLTNNIPFEQISSDPDDLINVHWNFDDKNIVIFYNCNNGTSNCNTTHQYNVSYAGTRIVSATAKESTRTQSEYDLSRVYVYKEGLTLFMIIDQPNYRIKEFPPTPIMVNATRTHVANCSRGKTSCEASAGTRICSQINDSINSADSLYCYVYAESSNSRFKFNWTIDNINKPEYPINSSPFEIIFPEGGKHDVNLKVVFNMS